MTVFDFWKIKMVLFLICSEICHYICLKIHQDTNTHTHIYINNSKINVHKRLVECRTSRLGFQLYIYANCIKKYYLVSGTVLNTKCRAKCSWIQIIKCDIFNTTVSCISITPFLTKDCRCRITDTWNCSIENIAFDLDTKLSLFLHLHWAL